MKFIKNPKRGFVTIWLVLATVLLVGTGLAVYDYKNKSEVDKSQNKIVKTTQNNVYPKNTKEPVIVDDPVQPKQDEPVPSNTTVQKSDEFNWSYCKNDSDCKIVGHPCCPLSHNGAYNIAYTEDDKLVDLYCEPLPLSCNSAVPMIPDDYAAYCDNNKCKVDYNKTISSNPIKNVAPVQTDPVVKNNPSLPDEYKCKTDSDCYDADGNAVGICEVPCSRTKAICDSGVCIRPIGCSGDCQ